jgi:hypothetical protein
MRLLWFFLILIIIKFVINCSKYVRSKWYYAKYMQWIGDSNEKMFEYKAQIRELFKDAGITDGYVGYVEPMGMMQIRTGNASVFENLLNRREDIVSQVLGMFLQAIGTYRSRMVETFNPLYWLEAAVNLPKHLSRYLGVSQESMLTKIAQVLWWFTATAVGFIYALYRPELEATIKSWISR